MEVAEVEGEVVAVAVEQEVEEGEEEDEAGWSCQ